jgi:hypothetical protein
MSKGISPKVSHPDLLMHPSRINIMAYAENFNKKKLKLKKKKTKTSPKASQRIKSLSQTNELYENHATTQMNGHQSKVRLTLNLNKNGISLKNKNLTPRTI